MAVNTFKEIGNAFRQELNDKYSETAVSYPNLPFEKPDNNTSWVRMTPGEGTASAIDIADKPTIRVPGVMVLEIFTPIEDGDTRAREIADILADIFRYNNNIDNTLFREPSYVPVGRSDQENGTWYRADLRIPYRVDTRHEI